MKKVPLLITCGVVLLIAGGYFLYEKLWNKPPVKIWDVIPEDAVAVYERSSCQSCVDEVSGSLLAKVIERTAFYKEPVDSLRAKINSVLKNNPLFFISAHITRKDDFDLAFYLPNAKAADISKLFSNPNYKVATREFNGVLIHEVKYGNQQLSFTQIGNIWVGSMTSFLIEDVIRTYERNTNKDQHYNLRPTGFTSIKDDGGNVYLRLNHVSELLSIFSNDVAALRFPMGQVAALDVKAKDQSLVFNGFSSEGSSRKTILSIFSRQSPVSFGLKHLISNRALAVSSYGISDGKAFYEDLKKFTDQNNKRLQDSLNTIAAANNFDMATLYNAIADEFAVCFIEAPGRKVSKFLLIESNQPENWNKVFSTLERKLSIDTIFYEKYSQYEIREVPVFRFSEKLLWPFVSGFDQNFYTMVGNVIILGDNLEALKSFLNDIDAEETWGKSVAQNRFLESTLLESNVSIYFNPSRAWNILSGKLHPRWTNFLRENQRMLNALQTSSIQFSHLNDNFYTNFIFTYRPFEDSRPESPVARDRIVTNFDRNLLNLHAVRSHVNRSNEILIQDSLNDLSLVSSEGKVLWKLPIGDRIISDVTQIDYFNNGKLQYFFSTQSSIHVIDRLGNYVDPFPLHLSSTDIEHVSVVDYDNSKRYRILVSDRSGKLWMFDKEGHPLEGWRPKDVGGSLAMPPRHHRIKGKDYMVAIRKDGQMFVMNRRGENLKTFPINLEAIPSGDYSLEPGSSLENTYFVIVSQDGFKIKVNVQGKIQSREALMKTSVTSNFFLINEKTLKSYLVVQQDGKQLIIYDDTGKKIVSNNMAATRPADIKYFDFGSGDIFISLTDRVQGFSYIYDEQGNLLTSPPLECTALELRPVGSDQFKLFSIQGTALTIQPLEVH